MNAEIAELNQRLKETSSRKEKEALLKKIQARKALLKKILDVNWKISVARNQSSAAELEQLQGELGSLIKKFGKTQAQEKNSSTERHGIFNSQDIQPERGEEEFTTDDGSIFGSVEAAKRDMLESLKELGIEPLEKQDTRRPKLVDFVDDSDEALEAAIAEWNKEINKVSANPIFNPKLWTAGLKIGAIYVQRGINDFAA